MAAAEAGAGSGGGGSNSGVLAGAVDTLPGGGTGSGRGKVMDLFIESDKVFKVLVYLSHDNGATFTIVDVNASAAPADADATYANVLKLQRYALPSVWKIDFLNKDGANAAKYRCDLQIYDDLRMG